MRYRLLLPLFAFTILLDSCSIFFPSREEDGFIKVSGTHFTHDGKPYYYAGTNLWYGGYLGSPGATGNRDRLVRELDSLQALGITNVRVLALSEESYIKTSVKPAVQKAPGVLDEDLLAGLDFLLAEMGKRHMHAVIYLNNYWEWSGGMAQYNVWTGAPEVDPENPAQGWPAFMAFSATFYANEKANDIFRGAVKKIVMRKNTVNGRIYTQDPTIMSWQLANEPRPGPDNPETRASLPTFNRWIDGTAAFIHSLDTNHLVSSGSEGTVALSWEAEPYIQSHQSRSIDYLTFHLWAKNWGWFDPLKPEETFPSAEDKALSYIQQHCLLARQIGKPIVMEEFGLTRDSASFFPGSPVTTRDRYFKELFSVIYDSARSGSALAGTNFWAWGGEGRAQHQDYIWRPGDSFLGDPPQEPQGLYSVFVTDTTTVQIIRQHAYKMMRLGVSDSLYATH
jgi:mannan endo-1,4-beta-mannosidase